MGEWKIRENVEFREEDKNQGNRSPGTGEWTI
jgi:hypothetical protein